MKKIALVTVACIGLASPLAAQQSDGADNSGDKNGRDQLPVVVSRTVVVPSAPQTTLRPVAERRLRKPFVLPWFTGVFQ